MLLLCSSTSFGVLSQHVLNVQQLPQFGGSSAQHLRSDVYIIFQRNNPNNPKTL
jgi:hypothetical protein